MSCCVLAADAANGPTPQKSSKTGSVSVERRRRRYVRGAAALQTGSRRRRGCRVDMPWRRVAAATRTFGRDRRAPQVRKPKASTKPSLQERMARIGGTGGAFAPPRRSPRTTLKSPKANESEMAAARAEKVPTGLDFAWFFKRTAPACQHCKNHPERSSSRRRSVGVAFVYVSRRRRGRDADIPWTPACQRCKNHPERSSPRRGRRIFGSRAADDTRISSEEPVAISETLPPPGALGASLVGFSLRRRPRRPPRPRSCARRCAATPRRRRSRRPEDRRLLKAASASRWRTASIRGAARERRRQAARSPCWRRRRCGYRPRGSSTRQVARSQRPRGRSRPRNNWTIRGTPFPSSARPLLRRALSRRRRGRPAPPARRPRRPRRRTTRRGSRAGTAAPRCSASSGIPTERHMSTRAFEDTSVPVAAAPRLPRGHSAEASRSDAAASSRIFRGGESPRPRRG